jgi:hypothetical protein
LDNKGQNKKDVLEPEHKVTEVFTHNHEVLCWELAATQQKNRGSQDTQRWRMQDQVTIGGIFESNNDALAVLVLIYFEQKASSLSHN